MFFTVVLSNARLMEMQATMASNLVTATQSLPQYEERAFLFDTITWTYKIGNKTVSDSW